MGCSSLPASQAVSSNFFHVYRRNINVSYLPLLSTVSLSSKSRHCSFHLSPSPLNDGFKHRILRFKDVNKSSSHTNGKFCIRASSTSPEEASFNIKLVIVCSITVMLAVANRVLYKLALVPLKQYPFFLAQLTTFGYVAIYYFILYIRYRKGIVTDEMLSIPKGTFIIIGILEALGVATAMSSGAMLPGPAIPILNQTFLVWQLAFSSLLLGRTYSWNKIVGCLLVIAGIVVAVASGDGQMLAGIELVWPILMIASSSFQAVASILKESLFVNAKSLLKGKSLDIFVVNSFGSAFQALFVFLLLPFLSSLKGIPFSELPTYLKNGAGCFLNAGGNTVGCGGAPLLPLLYIVTNIAFNISVLNLLKISSAIVSSLTMMTSVPISIYILSRPLPYLVDRVRLSRFFLLGVTVVLIGLLLYNTPPLSTKQDPQKQR